MQEFDKLVDIIKRLRKECPWDSKQTPSTLTPLFFEEVYELWGSLGDKDKMEEELGDILLLVVMTALAANINIVELIKRLQAKLIRRHPHIFGDEKVATAEEVLKLWERVKGKPLLEELPNLPALALAAFVQRKASKKGFDWHNVEGVIEKIKEELEELQHASGDKQREEYGDLLFAVAHLGNFLGVDPETALKAAVCKFKRRFQRVLDKLKDNPNMTLEEMEAIWEKAKEEEQER